MICKVCSAPVGLRNKSGLCRKCCRTHGDGTRARPRVGNCSDCSIPISDQAKTGRCKSCANRSRNSTPEFRRKVSEGQKRRMLEPAFAEKKARIARRNAQKAYLDPDRRERAREIALAHIQLAFTPEAQQRRIDRIREARGKQTDKRLAWCPLEYRALHHRNVNSKRMKAADSRAMIEALIADKEALAHIDSALAWLSHYAPVEKLENGYRYGNAILRPAEVISRARIRGWQPDRWAA